MLAQYKKVSNLAALKICRLVYTKELLSALMSKNCFIVCD